MLERVVDQLADHPVEDHLDVRIEPLRTEVGREADFHVVHRGALVDEVLHAPRQPEVIEHVGRKVVRNLAQRTDRLVDHIGRIVDDLLLLGAAFVACQRRKRHPRRREQRPQPVVQFLREARTRLFLGAEHGREDAFVEQLPLAVKPADVLEELVGVHHADRQADRDHDPQVGEPPPGDILPAGHQQLHEPLDREQRKPHDEENPHRIVLGSPHQFEGICRRDRLDEDGDDKQDLNQHRRPDFLQI